MSITQQTLEGLRMGVTTALDDIFTDTYSRLMYQVYQIIKNEDEAHEIVTDLYLKLWELAKSFNSVEDLHAYLYMAAKNRSLNYLKLKGRRTELNEEKIKAELQWQDPHVFKKISVDEALKEIIKALPYLANQRAEIIKLILFEGQTHKEVAETLSISEEQVRSQKSLAIRELKKIIQKRRPDLDRLSIIICIFFLCQLLDRSLN